MKKSIFIAILWSVVFFAKAQTPTGLDGLINLNNIGSGQGIVRLFDNRYKGVQGNPYLNKNWWRTVFLLNNGKKTTPGAAKFDVYFQEVLYKTEKGDSLWVKKEEILAFTLNDDLGNDLMFKKLKSNDGKYEFYRYWEKEGKYILLMKYRKVLKKADFKGGYNAGNPYDEVLPASELYFIQKQDGTLLEIKLKTKDFAEATGTDEKKIKEYVKAQKLDLKEIDHALKLVAWLNQ